MIRRLALRERGRLHRWRAGAPRGEDSPDEAWLEERHFDRLFDHDQRRADGSVFDWRREEARVGQWVGVVQLPGLVLELLPKIDGDEPSNGDTLSRARDNLLVMLAEAGAVPLRSRDLADLSARRAPLHESLIVLFARRLLLELLRSPDRGYVADVDDLRTLRGKLLVGRHVVRNAARRERFTCGFDEFSIDTALSRVLRAACRLLLNGATSDAAREHLSHCLLVLADVGDVPDARVWLDRVNLSRQNERFTEVFEFSRLVIEQLAPTAHRGSRETFSLLFNMDRVFEGFLSGFLRRRVMERLEGTRLYPQAKSRRRHLLRGNQGGVLSLKPDLLLETRDQRRMVVDTKWKRLGAMTQRAQGGIGSGDLYQLFAYTRRYGARRSVLLFPFLAGSVVRDFDVLGPDGQTDGSQICVRFVNLHRNLRQSTERSALADELTTILRDGLEGA